MNARSDPVPLYKQPFTWLIAFFIACAGVGLILRAAGCAGPPPQPDDRKAEWQGDPMLDPDAANKLRAKMREAEAQGLIKWDVRGALLKVNEALMDDPKSAEAYHLRGRIVFDLSQYDRSVENYTKAIELWAEKRDARDASEAMRRFLDERILEALSDRGYASWVMGKLQPALRDHDEAVGKLAATESKTLRFSVHYRRGRARQDARDWKGAIADFEQAIAHHPTTRDRRVYQDLSILYLTCPDPDLRDPDKSTAYEKQYLEP